MRCRPTLTLLPVLIATLPFGCKKPQIAASVSPVPALAKSAGIDPAASIVETPTHFVREIRRGEEFQQSIGTKMVFRLEPYAGNDSGWTIRMTPGTDKKALSMDCIGAVSEPLHGDSNLSLEPPEGMSDKPVNWKPREFEFVPDSENCKIAWDLMNLVYYPSKLSDQQRAEAGEKLGKIPTAHGKFTVLASQLRPAANANGASSIEWLKFEVELSLPAAVESPNTHAQDAPKSDSGAKGIRDVDLKAFLSAHYQEINPQLDLETECGEGQKPIQSIAPFQYGDLDGDGREEAVFMAYTCMSGTGGTDFYGVLKLLPGGKIISLPIQDAPKPYKGRDPYAGLRGRTRLEIQGGKLLQIFPTYPDEKACNSCSEGERKFIYRWDGHQFVVDDIIDGPPSSNRAIEKQPA